MSYSPFIDLYDFPGKMETCWQSILVAALAGQSIGGVQVVINRNPAILATPRIELIFATGPAMQQRTTAGQSGANRKQVPNAFEGVLSAKVFTTRPLVTDNAELHAVLVALVMWQMSAGARVVNGTNLPGLQILDMLPESATPTVYDPKSQDETNISFHVWFAIVNSAWPQES
jgi:hypothetical protein